MPATGAFPGASNLSTLRAPTSCLATATCSTSTTESKRSSTTCLAAATTAKAPRLRDSRRFPSRGGCSAVAQPRRACVVGGASPPVLSPERSLPLMKRLLPAALLVAAATLLFTSAGCGPSMSKVECKVTLDGQPVEGATVTFNPVEKGGLAASGFTDSNGVCVMRTGAD